jgi:hypothetical protein
VQLTVFSAHVELVLRLVNPARLDMSEAMRNIDPTICQREQACIHPALLGCRFLDLCLYPWALTSFWKGRTFAPAFKLSK